MRPLTARAGSVWRGPLPTAVGALVGAVGRHRPVRKQVTGSLCQCLNRIREDAPVRADWTGQTEFN